MVEKNWDYHTKDPRPPEKRDDRNRLNTAVPAEIQSQYEELEQELKTKPLDQLLNKPFVPLNEKEDAKNTNPERLREEIKDLKTAKALMEKFMPQDALGKGMSLGVLIRTFKDSPETEVLAEFVENNMQAYHLDYRMTIEKYFSFIGNRQVKLQARLANRNLR